MKLLKSGGLLLLFLFSIFIIACSGDTGNTNTVNTNGPVVTVTIRMGANAQQASPTPKLPPLWCGAWTTQSTPLYDESQDEKATVAVYAKFTKNVNGNPAGIEGATAIATVHWPGGSTEQQTVTTTGDGLAVFFVSLHNKGFAVDKVTLISVNFSKSGVGECKVDPEDNPAFFSLLAKPSPTKKPDNDNNNNDDDNKNKNNNKDNKNNDD
jgi:hypothetical protein